MTKLEIIKELFDNYYVKYPWRRALDEYGSCVYKTEDKVPKYCAVGKCLTKSGIQYAINYTIGTVDEFYDENTDQITVEPFLKRKYRGHSMEFWRSLQLIHDETEYWTDKSITEVGKTALERLKIRYA